MTLKAMDEKDGRPISLIEAEKEVSKIKEKADGLSNEGNDDGPEGKGQIGNSTTMCKSENVTGISVEQDGETVKAHEEDGIPPTVTSSSNIGNRTLKWDDSVPCQTKETTKTQKVRTDSCKDDNGFTYYKCRFCGLTFNYMTTLKAHERVHDISQPYLCNKCGESFHYMCELEYHAKSHLQQKGYKCECGRTFYQYTDLLYHKHPGEDEPFPAVPVPSASLADFGPLMPSGSASIHPAEFPTPEFAELGFEPKYQLKRGLSDVRSKPYICQYCSKSYADSRGLAYHMYSHRGERMFNPRASRYLMCRNDNSYISPGLDLRDA